jgi:hypothetical protein
MRRASEATLVSYERGAAAMLLSAKRALEADDRRSGSPDDLLLTLETNFRDYEGGLASGTVCVYRQHARAAIAQLVRSGADADAAVAIEISIMAELQKRLDLPREARGPALKIDAPEKREVKEVFELLRRRFFKHGNVKDLLLSLYVLLMPRLGLRPIEITWARREGMFLKVATAKRRGRPERDVPLTGWPEDYLFALDVLLELVPRKLGADAFRKWRNALASRLARVSKQSQEERRLSLYFCRHIFIASWRDIGMSPEQIRKMVGHAGLASQRGYARGKSGYGARWMFPKPATPQVSETVEKRIELPEGPGAGAALEGAAAGALPAISRHDQPGDAVPTDANLGDHPDPVEFDPFPGQVAARSDGIDARAHFRAIADEAAELVDRVTRPRGRGSSASPGTLPTAPETSGQVSSVAEGASPVPRARQSDP